MEGGGTFSDRLKASRKALGLSQDEVAKRAGIKQGSYSELERGKSKSSRHLIELAQALQVDPHWLATGVPSSDLAEQISAYLRLLDDEQKHLLLKLIHTWTDRK